MVRPTMETAAWRNLSVYAQALYPWIKLEWHGPKANNNGKIRFSLRQAAEAVGMSKKSAGKAFHELQSHGFLVMREPANLGVSGDAQSPAWEITEIAMPGDGTRPQNLFRDWAPGRDFPVYRAPVRNPKGHNGTSIVKPFKVVQ